VVKTEVLLEILEKLVAESIESVYNEDDQLHTVAVAGLPLAAEGERLSDAVDELVEDIRVYCNDWVARLRFAPNHAGNIPLVYLAQSMSDDELRAVLTAAHELMTASVETGRERREVYNRAGRPCPRCGERIRARGQGDANRTTYWCPVCQT